MQNASDKEEHATQHAERERGCVAVDDDACVAGAAWGWPVGIDVAAHWRRGHGEGGDRRFKVNEIDGSEYCGFRMNG